MAKPHETDRAFLGTVGYRTLLDQRYEGGDGAVDVFVLVGDVEQRYRSPISPKTLPPGSGWIVEERGELGRDGALEPTWTVMRAGTRRVLVHHWYEGTRGRADEIWRGLTSLDASPWHRASDAMAVRITTEIRGATAGALERARARLAAFEAILEPELDLIRERLVRKESSRVAQSGKIFSHAGFCTVFETVGKTGRYGHSGTRHTLCSILGLQAHCASRGASLGPQLQWLGEAQAAVPKLDWSPPVAQVESMRRRV